MQADLQAQVKAAQSGDSDAFRWLVSRFQDQVTAAAYSWTGDTETAREVAQEVFLEAHLNLTQLSTPLSFPGWLRRIVTKHCDRVTRRRQLALASTQPDDQVDHTIDPARAAERSQLAEQLRLAVAALPESQRIVLALSYFADITGEEIAAFLELPLTTVKKRLHDARRKLKEHGERLMQESINHMKPSSNSTFTEEVTFFIALRNRDHDEVARLLAANPALANAEQDWSHELAHQRVLPFPNRATALITTVELDDEIGMEQLLAAGADPDGLCGCATGESAVWAAALFNRPRHLSRLLVAGANPDVISAAGNSPLHVAAMRGYDEIVEILLEAGADPMLLDQGIRDKPPLVANVRDDGTRRTAADWALRSGHQALASRLAGDGHDDTVPVCRAKWRDGRIETGIRAIDFFSPLPEHSLIRFPFGAGVGMLVLMGELSLRFSAAGSAVVWTGFTQPPFDRQDFDAELSELGIQSAVTAHLASFSRPASERREAFNEGLAAIAAHRHAGRHVFAVIMSTQGFEQEIEACLPTLVEAAEGGLTPLVMTPFKDEDGPWKSLRAPFTNQWTLDRSRANARLYPAIDPTRSPSDYPMSGRHAVLRSNVIDVMAGYRETDPTLEKFARGESERSHPVACKLLNYFSQSFQIATPFGGVPGDETGMAQLLDDVERLLADGNPDSSL